MAHSGKFRSADLGSEWRGYELVAEVCERSAMTNRQAEVTLLYTRGCDHREIQQALRVKWKEVWRARRRASQLLERAYPQLRSLVALAKLQDRDQVQDAKTVLLAIRGPRRSTGRTVEIGAKDDYGRQLPAGLHPQLVSLTDLLELQFTALDLVPVLLAELAERREGKPGAGA